ncbi:hypothetical protein K7W42_21865 [Deinococcus sp. HMF7604]|uniref:hypothetical protein n=1 Tax=Deinococcus betulae TaxID=2873312 RepID=UPI001CCD4060|nr:hypothetical protein [Deinococcus betulae]MBZ9753484.1 hypothetical protein [Deinococcus betulae]
MPLTLLTLPLLMAAVPAQAFAFARRLGWDWVTMFGVVLLGIVLSTLMAPALKASPFWRLGMVLLACSCNVGNMLVQNPTLDGLSLIGNIILLYTFWDEHGPRTKRRIDQGRTQAVRRFARPVMGNLAPVS